MRMILKTLLVALLTTFPALAQIPAPQINLTGNLGCQGFPCLNNGTLIMPADANYSLTAQETSALSMKVTSAVTLTTTRNLVWPAGRFQVDVENATTGGQSIRVIGASGTGVVITNGQTVRVWNDGTNFVQVGASGSGTPASPFLSFQANVGGSFAPTPCSLGDATGVNVGCSFGNSINSGDNYTSLGESCLTTNIPGFVYSHNQASSNCFSIFSRNTFPGWALGNPGTVSGSGMGWYSDFSINQNDYYQSAGIKGGYLLGMHCAGVGDCNVIDANPRLRGGTAAYSDEGSAYQLKLLEDVQTNGTIQTGGGGTGANTLTVNKNQDTDGVGQAIIDTTDDVISTTLTAVTAPSGTYSVATIVATVPVSVSCSTVVSDVAVATQAEGVYTTFTVNLNTSVDLTSSASSHLLFTTLLPYIQTNKLISAGTFTGTTQTVTVGLNKSIAAGSRYCVGGMAGRGMEQVPFTISGQKYILSVIGSPTNHTVQVSYMGSTGPKGDFVGYRSPLPMSVNFYHSATIVGGVATTNSFTISDNDAAWTDAATWISPNYVTNTYVYNLSEVYTNPYITDLGFAHSVNGLSLLAVDQFSSSNQNANSNYTSYGGIYAAPVAMHVYGLHGAGFLFENAPEDLQWQGNFWTGAAISMGLIPGGSSTTDWWVADYRSNDDRFGYKPGTRAWEFIGTGGITYNSDPVCTHTNGQCTGAGTVTSVALSMPGVIFNATVPGSPITTSGTLAPTLLVQSANTIFAGPTTGASATPTFRVIVPADLPLATTGAFGVVKPDGTSITISAGVISATSGSGTVTHTAGALTAQKCVIGNGTADIKVDPNCSLDGSGNISAVSATLTGTTPGTVSLVAGTGTIPALPANSAGLAGPATGGTSYLIQPPATMTAGIAHFGAPGSVNGVLQSALTSSAVSLTADVSGLLPVASGGTGTSSPSLVAGTNVTITGTWPNQTVSATAGGGGVSSFSGDGSLLNNSSSTGGVTATLANAGAHKFWGNNTASTAAPGYQSVGVSDFFPNSYIAGAGSVNVLTATMNPAATALTPGLQVYVLPNLANTTTNPTLNISGLGAVTIMKSIAGTISALVANDYVTTIAAHFFYDGTNMILLNPQSAAAGSSSALSAITAATGSNTIANGNNPQTWNWAQTTNSQAAMTFGETTAATGTSDKLLALTTLSGSTAVPLTISNATTSGQVTNSLVITPTWNSGVSAPTALLINVTNTSSAATSRLLALQIAGSNIMNVDVKGFTKGVAFGSIGTKFTTTGCSVSSTTGGAAAGVFTLGANTCTTVVTINGATGMTATNGWSCYANDQTSATVFAIQQTASSTTTASFSIPATAGATDVINFGCTAY